MQEYYRAKNEREKEYEDMMAKKKYEKELEIAKIQASQQASQDLQAAKDELNMIRTQDQVIFLIFIYKLLRNLCLEVNKYR